MLPNETHEFSTGWRAAQKGGLAGCTTGQASVLHISNPPFSAGPPFSAAHLPTLLFSVQPTDSSRFSFGNTTLQPARPSN